MALMRTLIAAGLKRGRRSFVGIFLLMTLTGAALTFTVSMYVDLNAREEAALAEIEAGDVYAVDVAANLNRDVADEIEALPEVSEARLNDALGVPVKYYRGDGTTVDKNPTSGTALVAWGDALDFRLFSEDGRSLVADTPEPGPNEVYVPVSMQVSPGVHKGDELEVIVGDSTRRLSIAGFYEDPQMGSPFIEIKRYLVAERTFDEVAAEVDAATLDGGRQELFSSQGKLASSRMAELNVRLTDEARAAVEARFGDAVDTRATGMFADTTGMIGVIQQLFTVMGYAMAGVAAALAFLAVSLIIGRMFTAERHDLGVYLALGFTSRALRLQFALRFFLVALVGCALGATAATLGGGWLMGQLFGLFGVSRFAIDTNPLMVGGLTLGLALVFLVAAYASARKVRRVDVRELVAE